MRIVVEEHLCIAAGSCAATAPDVFDQRDEDGIVVVLQPEPAPHLAGDVRAAASVCPARAITLVS